MHDPFPCSKTSAQITILIELPSSALAVDAQTNGYDIKPIPDLLRKFAVT